MLDANDINDDVKRMNKLILVGNGFDLALGLKTSYNDFLFWYLKSVLKEAINRNEYLFCTEQRLQKFYYYKDMLTTIYRINNGEQERLLVQLNRHDTLEKLQEFLKKKDLVVMSFQSTLFEKIYESSIVGWVDVEAIYYQLLTKNLGKKETVIQLNRDLNFIKQKLEEYLSTLNIEEILENENRKLFVSQFHDGILPSDVVGVGKDEFISHEDTYCLNFNYTESVKKIIESVPTRLPMPIYVNHIHGVLNSEEEKVVFGFGDEMDKDYSKIESLNDNTYLEHIKSFNYFKNKNYRHLLSYLESRDYQVCVYGHSCGLSDRIMLNEIFEHKNCKSIKLYFYEDEDGKNDFTNKTMEISRHFKNNQMMRSKIVEFNPQNKIPQL